MAYSEVLAYLAPAAGVRATRLADVFVEDEPSDPRTLLEAIEAEWDQLVSIHPLRIVAGWHRDNRLQYQLRLPKDGWFVDIDHADSVRALNRGLDGVLATRGIPRLTTSHLAGEDRHLTTLLAEWIREQTLADGSQPHGVRYRSKHGEDGHCWAVWLRVVDDGGNEADEPTKAEAGEPIGSSTTNPILEKVARGLGLHILP